LRIGKNGPDLQKMVEGPVEVNRFMVGSRRPLDVDLNHGNHTVLLR